MARIKAIFDADKIPRIIKHKGSILTFENMMGRCYDKLHSSDKLKGLINNIIVNVEKGKI